MTEQSSDPFSDVINLVAAPIATGLRTFEQYKRGVDEMFRTVDNLNRTMENLNETSMRLNRLLGDVEEPIRAMIPQLTRTIQTADEITSRMRGPVAAVAPNIEKVVDTLSSPGFANLPQQLGEFMGAISEMSKRLGPLTQLAESAGGLFGGLRIPGMGSPRPVPSDSPIPPGGDALLAPARKASAKKAPATRAPSKTGAKRSATKKSAAKKAAAKKSSG